ncbi:MAG: efflux RND transporter periplasmic adaptor subunit [Candidatus Polarisedimenticolia bacterium]
MRLGLVALALLVAAALVWVAVGGRPAVNAEGQAPAGEAAAGARPPGMRPSPVRYTEAREHAVARTLQLPGSVESPKVSIVASEVEGLVQSQDAREGDTVRKGQPLAHLRTDALTLQLHSAEAQHKEAQSRLKMTEVTLSRLRDLAASDVVSRQDLDNATYESTAWQGRVESLQAQIDRIRLDIDRCVIRAPFAGRVVAERSQAGQWLQVGGPVVELMALDDMEVRVEVPERYFGALETGGEAKVTFPTLDGMTLTGRVSAVVPRADRAARTFPLKIRLTHPEGNIGSGMLVQVSFFSGASLPAIIVPKDALVTQGEARFVYRLQPDGTAQMVPVTPGQGAGSWVAVEGEIAAGDKVITRGNERLQPGMAVQGEPLEYELP